ncbi:hypothetical protein V8B97DRAFT_1929029 [Scleroderma yunnanense]
MRLSAFAITPLVVASAVFARSSNNSRLHRRVSHSTDVCAYLNTSLQFPDIRENGKAYIAGPLDATVCLSQVETFIKGNDVAQEAVKVVGEHKVQVTLTAMIQSSGTQCSYPHHSAPSVTSSNPCGFKCIDGFLPTPADHPTTCECPSHLTECDGKCGHFHPDQCPKTAPPSRRQNEPKCSDGLQLCGTGTTNGNGWKCADIKTSTSNCGGCTKASPFGSSATNGVNCNEIPNVKKASCSDGGCVVEECEARYVITPKKDNCIPVPKGPETRRVESQLDPASAVASVIKGTEHRRSDFQTGIVHGESLVSPLGPAKAISAAGIQSKPEGTTGSLIHSSELKVPGVGSLSASTKAEAHVNHRGVPVAGSTSPLKSTEGTIAASKLSPESSVGQFKQGGGQVTPVGTYSHSTNAGVKIPSRGVAPMILAHGAGTEDEGGPRGGSPRPSTSFLTKGAGLARDISDEDADELPAGEMASGAQ